MSLCSSLKWLNWVVCLYFNITIISSANWSFWINILKFFNSHKLRYLIIYSNLCHCQWFVYQWCSWLRCDDISLQLKFYLIKVLYEEFQLIKMKFQVQSLNTDYTDFIGLVNTWIYYMNQQKFDEIKLIIKMIKKFY